MPVEDRVITTTFLEAFNNDLGRWVQLSAAIMSQLEPLGHHVLVPTGHVHDDDEQCVVVCDALLRLRESDEPHRVKVLVPAAVFEDLPTAFAAIGAMSRMICLDESDLAALVTDFTGGGEPSPDVDSL